MKVQKTKEKEQLSDEEIITRKKYKKDLLICLVYAIVTIIYFVGINTINILVDIQSFDIYVKSFYMTLILISIILFEIAYKKESKKITVTGIEFMLLALHTLLVGRSITLFNEQKENFILLTSYVWPVYYCLKAIIVYTSENKRRLKQISDIHEIVKEEKPTKKVAKKRKS